MNFAESIVRSCKEHPNKTACTICGISVTYGELAASALKLAERLSSAAYGPAVIYGKRSTAFLSAILGCMIAERMYIPCDESCPEMRLADICRQSAAAAVISDRPLCFTDMPDLILTAAFSGKKRAKGTNELPVPHHKMLYTIFTSGSTGEPKGVPISAENMQSFLDFACSDSGLGFTSNDIVLGTSVFSFDLSCADIFPSLANGATFISVSPEELAYPETWQTVRHITRLNCTPTFLRLLMTCPSFSAEYMPDLKTAVCCGEPLRAKTAVRFFARFPKAHLINAYGPTEACCAVSASEIFPDEINEAEDLPCGDIKNAACEIFLGKNNEIILRGKSVFGGYLNAPQSVIRPDGSYPTGDKGRIENGRLYCISRLDGMIKYKGYRIETGEIESAACRFPNVDAAKVTAVRDSSGDVRGIKLTAFCNEKSGVSPASLIGFLSEYLPEYMLPTQTEISHNEHLTASGKIK